jgi:hypothetical protein
MSDRTKQGGASFRAVIEDLLRLYGKAAGKDGSQC